MTASLEDENAELRRANAELGQRLDEAFAQHAATAEVLQVINSSPGDLAAVFDAVLEKAVSLTEAVYGHLWRFDGEHFHPWRSHGDPEFARWFEHLGPVRPNPNGFLGRVVRGEHVLHIADVRDTEPYGNGSAPVTGLADVAGGRSVLTVALRKDHALLGALTVYRREVKQFSEKQISPKLRGAGSDCDRKCAAVDRDARGIGAPDRHRRGLAGHQRFAGRPRPSLRSDARQGDSPLRGGARNAHGV